MSNGEGKEGTVFHTKEKMNFIIPIMEKKYIESGHFSSEKVRFSAEEQKVK